VAPRSVFSDKVHVKEVRVESPEITFEGGLKGNNLSRLLDNVQAATGSSDKPGATAKEKSSSKKLQVDDFVLSGGKINLSVDAGPLGGKSATVLLPEIRLTNLGSGPDGITGGGTDGESSQGSVAGSYPRRRKSGRRSGQEGHCRSAQECRQRVN